MADDPKTPDPKTPPAGETDEEKTTRLESERAANAAEEKVKGWVKEAISEATPSLLETIKKGLPSTGGASATSPTRKRSNILETILRG